MNELGFIEGDPTKNSTREKGLDESSSSFEWKESGYGHGASVVEALNRYAEKVLGLETGSIRYDEENEGD